MADFSALIAQIEAYVKQNGNNEITGNGLQSILVGMVNALGTVAITALQGDLADEVTARTNADGAINAKIPAEASSSNKLADKAFVTGLTTPLQNAVNAINANIENGYVYAGIATPSGTPVSGKVFYLARQAGTYTNFGGLTLTEGVNILKYNGTAWSQEQLISIADIYKNPLIGYYECDTAGATAAKTVAATGYVLPATGGSVKIKMANRNTVANATLNINSTGAKPLYYNGTRAGVVNTWDNNEIVEVFFDGTNYQAYNVAGSNGDGVFDISAYNLTDGQPTPYVDLAAALGTNGEHVPQSYRKGGMSVKFIQGSVQSSDNKYEQYRLMAQSFTTDTTQWAIAEEGVYVENPEFIYVKTDAEDKILWAIKKDGGIYYGAGVPQQIVDYINEKISELSLDEYEDIVTFLGNLIEGDTLATLLNAKANAAEVNTALNTKVDKVTGKSLINAEYANNINYEESPEFIQVTTDNENRVLEGHRTDGVKIVNSNILCKGIDCTDIQVEDIYANDITVEKLYNKTVDISLDGVTVSDFKTEAMTQTPSVQSGNDGYLYVSYFANPTIKYEYQAEESVVKLSKFPVCDLYDNQVITVLAANDTVGDFHQSPDIGPYDTQLWIEGDNIYYFMVCSESEYREDHQICMREINKNTLELGDTMSRLMFSYQYGGVTVTVPLMAKNMAVYAARKEGLADDAYCPGRPIMCNIVKQDGYYYSYFGFMKGNQDDNRPGHFGVIAVSQDLINWEEFSYPIGLVNDYHNVIEMDICISNDKMYACLRTDGHYRIYSIDMTSKSWSQERVFQDKGNPQRPCFYKKGDNIYLFITGPDERKNDNGQTIIRTNIISYKFSDSLELLGKISINSRYGLTYMRMVRVSEGEYIVCAENRRWDYFTETGTDYPCSDIAVIPTVFLDNL